MKERFELRLDRFDRMRENNPVSETQTDQDSHYKEPGYARNVCFIWPDGSRIFSQYAYLNPGKFDPNGEMNKIVLDFSSHIVTLTGYRLESLAMEFLDHLPRIVTAVEPRYASVKTNGPIVTGIEVEYKGD